MSEYVPRVGDWVRSTVPHDPDWRGAAFQVRALDIERGWLRFVAPANDEARAAIHLGDALSHLGRNLAWHMRRPWRGYDLGYDLTVTTERGS